jgi:outer membrane protein, heavy metal efflux system
MRFSIYMRVGLLACLCTFSAWVQPVFSKERTPQYSDVNQLATVINRALKSNPEMKAAQAAVDAAKARLTGAGLPLNNPELEVEAERTDIKTYTIGISQAVDWHNKKDAFEQVARSKLIAAQKRVEALRLTKATELLSAIGGITTHEKITSLSKRRSKILERFNKLAKKRYTAGDISKAELGLARLSLAEAVMNHAGNGSELIQAGSDFFSLSGQPLGSNVKFPDHLPSTLHNPTSADVLARSHPQVQAAHQTAQAAKQQIRAADQERKADPTFGLAAGREDKENLVALSFSIPLQVRNNFSSNVDAARSEALQAEQEARQIYQNLKAKINSARERYKIVANAWKHWVSQGSISLQQRIKLLEAAWQAGEMSTTDYLIQVQQTLDTQIAGIELQGDLRNAWIEWLSASGTLEEWLKRTLKEQ